jgi:hypothetical protein
MIDDEAPVNGGIKGDNGFTLKYIVEGRDITTYATVAPEQGEEEVRSLHLLFFQPSNNSSGTFIEAVEVNGTLSMNTSIPITLPPNTSLTTSGEYNVLAVANLIEGDYLGGTDFNVWKSQLRGRTEADVMEWATATATASTLGTDDSAILPGELLMHGVAVKPANSGNLSLILTRNLVRFDVSNNERAAYDLVSTSIWNAYPMSSIFGKSVLDYSSNTGRIRRFYGITNTNVDGAGLYKDISGGLYAFENEVPAPKNDDELTTCLIIGLRKRGTNTVSYYRVNIRPRGTAQALKRNNVYRVSINNVFGPGAPNEDEAYTGIGTDLGYTINYWDLDDNGVIVQDGNNILAVPTKLVRIGTQGGEFTYSIYTFSSSGQAAPLQIKNQTWDPQTSDIRATLNGNTLVIKATPLVPIGSERNGVITLSFGGLETSITVIQSGQVNEFLEVILPPSGLPPFGPSPDIYSGDIEVRASGTWRAEMYGDPAFSFIGSSHSPRVDTLSSRYNAMPLIRDGKYFKVWTLPNIDLTQKKAFIVVSLDSDPVNHVSIIPLVQNPRGGIHVSPTTLTFTVTNYAIPQQVTVDGSTANGSKMWRAELLPGANADKFTISPTPAEGDGSSPAQRTFTVRTVDQNLSGSSYTATIRVRLVSEPNTYTDIPVIQESARFSISTGNISGIPCTGGDTPQLINVNADASLFWSAGIIMTSGVSSDGRSLKNHNAYLIDASGKTIPPGTVLPVNTPFKVRFPKVYYPNRGITGITANVTLTLHDSNGNATPLTLTFTVTQEPLLAAPLHAANMRIKTDGAGGTVYGSLLSGTYETKYRDVMKKTFTTIYDGRPQPNTTFLHACAYDISLSPPGWSTIESFRKTRDAVTVLSMVTSAKTDILRDPNSVLTKLGYLIGQYVTAGANTAGFLNESAANTRVYKFLVTNGKYHVPSNTKFYADDIATEASILPSTAVSVIRSTNRPANTILAVDPANKIIYIGDLQAVGYEHKWTPERDAFLNNLALYIRYAAEYGSHFTDLLNDASGVPDLWDPVWQGNASF